MLSVEDIVLYIFRGGDMSCLGRIALSIVVVAGVAGCATSNPRDDEEIEEAAGEATGESSSALSDPSGFDPVTSLGSTWCCRARTVFSDSWSCFQFKTLGVWAAAKCGAFFAGVPLVDGIRLSKESCSSVPECM